MIKRLLMTSVLTTTVLCTACVPPIQNAYKMGEQNFKVQNYYTAFQNLMVAAKGGIANAQYAVGYMYFYGLGVAKSEPWAVYWLQQAAQNGQPQAIAVMQQITSMEENPVLHDDNQPVAKLTSLAAPQKNKTNSKTKAAHSSK